MFNIFFGGISESVSLNDCIGLNATSALKDLPFRELKKKLYLNQIMVLNQVHGTDGLIITERKFINIHKQNLAH